MQRRWCLRLGFSVLLTVVLAFAYPSLEASNALPALRLAVQRLAPTKNLRALQGVLAVLCGQQQLRLSTAAHRGMSMSGERGISLRDNATSARMLALGSSDDALTVLWTFANALHGTVDRDSPPQLGHASLEQYSRSVHTVVGRSSQQHGVAAPEVNVASPEGIANSTVEVSSRTSASGLPLAVADELRAAAPRDWLPAHGCEPLDPPYGRFCQGPRRAAAPFGPAHELAKQLELGTLPTVNRLLSSEPRKDWVVAAGGPTGTREHLSWPVRSGSLWRRFGYVRRPPFEHLLHRGIDVGAPHGTPLLAANGGIVAYSDNRVRGYGNLLVIVHADASVTFSAHCRAIYVFPGQRVQRGQIVGEVGDTGLARGAHVHWEYHVHGRPVDPERSFLKRGSS